MENLDLKKYFEKMDKKYYDPIYIVTIIEYILEKNIDEVKDELNSLKITVTEDEIKEYLQRRFAEDDPELKKRIETPKTIDNISTCSMYFGLGDLKTPEEKRLSRDFIDGLAAQKYRFEPYTLDYFHKYSDIVRSKALLLLSIIESIGKRSTTSIMELLEKLDINLDAQGNISKEDIIRLISPTIYNIKELYETIATANDLSTYLTFKMSKHSLLKDGINENEIYPNKSLQLLSLDQDHIKGNVPLSNNQRAKLNEESKSSIHIVTKMLLK